MAMPAGITTRTLTFGAAFDLINGTDMSMQVLVDPSRSMVWRATGSPAIAIQQTFDAGDGLQHEMDVPITDQVGWGDGNGNLIDVSGGKQSHLYRVTIKYLRNNRVVLTSESKWIAVPLGDGSPIDLDDLIPASGAGGATIFIPDTWDARISELEALIITTDGFMASKVADSASLTGAAVDAKIGTLKAWAKDVDNLIAGAITYASGLVASAVVEWPDGAAGVLTILSRQATTDAVTSYKVTRVDGGVTTTYTQPTITRNSSGAATLVPQITVA